MFNSCDIKDVTLEKGKERFQEIWYKSRINSSGIFSLVKKHDESEQDENLIKAPSVNKEFYIFFSLLEIYFLSQS